MFTSEDEWKEAINSAKEELSMAYIQGKIDIAEPIEASLNDLASRIARRVITSTHVLSN